MRLTSSRRRPAATAAAVQRLESRLLMTTATTITATSQEEVLNSVPPVLADLSDPSSNDVDLAGTAAEPSTAIFTDPNVPGTLVTFQTSKGNILVSLTDTATPKTVANFLSYVTSGAYDDTIFHRSALDAAGSGDISSSNPAGIIQGGGYTVGSSGLTHIPTNAPVADEYTTEEYGDIAGTIAMAKTSDADSATSEWYFNNLDESSSLDTPTTDSNGNTTSYTVFGKVLEGMDVISDIADLPTVSNIVPGSTAANPTETPIAGLTQTQINDNAPIGSSNLVYVYNVTEEAGTTYTVTSSDPSLVVPSISNDVLSFKYGSSQTGTAIISVMATNVYDSTTASTSFAVTVPPASSTTTGPVATADTLTAVAATNTSTGAAVTTPATLYPLNNDTDATAALSPGTLTVVSGPTHGTATIGTTGQIVYTATTVGYTGTDSFTYSVSDADGNASAATTVTVNVIAAPATVTIGTGTKVRSIAFTQPDGTKGHLSVTGGSAVVTFSAGAVTTKIAGGVETVTGAGATIADVVVSNNKNDRPIITISTTGKGTATLGGLSDTGGVAQLVAPTTDLTGALAVAGLQRLVLGSADDATMTIGEFGGGTVASIGTATDSSLSAGSLTSLTSKQWLNNDGGAYSVTAVVIGTLNISGAFADALSVTSGSGYGVTTANVNAPSGTWQVAGAIRKATVINPTSGWSLDDNSVVQTLTVKGDLSSDVTAAVIDDMTVTGAMTKAVVQTDALFNSAATQLLKLSVAGAITQSTIATNGNVGTITAKSLTASQIYAGVASTTIGDDALPSSTSDLQTEATIKSVSLTARKATFASSEIAAYVIDRVALGTVTASNGGTGFGLSAHVLDAVSAVLDPGGALSLTKAQTKSAAVLTAYLTKHKKALSDFDIVLY